MGFCRRCGEIVVGPRCKCGGMAVAPVVPWKQLNPREQNQDRWSKTYVSREKSPTRPLTRNPSTNNIPSVTSHATGLQPGSPTKRFPRPISGATTNPGPISSRVTAHIANITSHITRPPSPLKQSTTPLCDSAIESGILPSPYTSTLAKVYGSVLQPKETLAMHSCAICDAPFQPDATIYPDPNEPSGNTRFLCRLCFTTNGGSKGNCPGCSRPVLALKSEGTFVTAAGRVWHKKCFRCDGCFKLIGDTPMVDLLGKPSCVDCFDNCLKRDGSTPKKKWDSPRDEKGSNGNLGGLKAGKSREGSPAMEELEQRLGIARSRENSPTLEDLSHRLSLVGNHSENRQTVAANHASAGSPLSKALKGRADPLPDDSPSPSLKHDLARSRRPEGSDSPGSISPIRYSSPKPTEDAIEAMKNRFLKSGSSSPVQSPNSRTYVEQKLHVAAAKSTPPSKIPVTAPASRQSPASPRGLGSDKKSAKGNRQEISPVPDLVSDYSDTTTQSSGPSSPPRDEAEDDVFEGQGTVRGRVRSKSTGAGKHPLDGYGRGDYFGDVQVLNTPACHSNAKYTITPASKSTLSPGKDHYTSQVSIPTILPSATCARCNGPLFNLHANATGGRFVTVPEDRRGEGKEPKTYHTDCFRCTVCDGTFKGSENGRTVFVRGEKGACHVECVKPKKINVKSAPVPDTKPKVSVRPTNVQISPMNTHATSSSYREPPLTAPPASSSVSFPRFGAGSSCPGCHKAVSPMERGVVPGPQGTRWHAGCLVCGGKKETARNALWKPREDRRKGEPGCGKKLDSAAKSDGEGGIWCRECLLLLPAGMRGSPHGSPTRSGLVPTHTGNTPARIAPQFTGMTTLARQFTGFGAGDAALLRQLTGGGLSPTRQLGSPTKGLLDRSPTKQLPTIRERPRPKSVIGMRGMKSIDEGRGMYLVRQMTGGGGGGGWD